MDQVAHGVKGLNVPFRTGGKDISTTEHTGAHISERSQLGKDV